MDGTASIRLPRLPRRMLATSTAQAISTIRTPTPNSGLGWSPSRERTGEFVPIEKPKISGCGTGAPAAGTPKTGLPK